MNTLIRGKKAQGKIVTAGPLVTATIVVAILFVVFFILTRAVSPTPKVSSSELAAKEQILDSLIAYLNTPVNVDNQEIKMSDLIRLTRLNPAYKDALKAETEGALGKTYENYAIEIKDILSLDKGITKTQNYKETIKIPDNIEITLYVKQ